MSLEQLSVRSVLGHQEAHGDGEQGLANRIPKTPRAIAGKSQTLTTLRQD